MTEGRLAVSRRRPGTQEWIRARRRLAQSRRPRVRCHRRRLRPRGTDPVRWVRSNGQVCYWALPRCTLGAVVVPGELETPSPPEAAPTTQKRAGYVTMAYRYLVEGHGIHSSVRVQGYPYDNVKAAGLMKTLPIGTARRAAYDMFRKGLANLPSSLTRLTAPSGCLTPCSAPGTHLSPRYIISISVDSHCGPRTL